MAGSGAGELGELGKKKSRIGNLGDGPSNMPSLSSFCREKRSKADEGNGDGTVESGGGGAAGPLGGVWFGSHDGDIEQVGRTQRGTISFSFSWMACGCFHGQNCEELWQGKAHIPHISKVQGLSKMAAYSLSIMDGKRTRITRNDLCNHMWEFHFTEGAPEYWRNLDPYWQGTGAPMHRDFHTDGSITADPDDRVWGGHESSYTIVTGLLPDGKIREHYVRINRWPQMSVQRKPDWSWVLSNHLHCFSSILDADKPDGTGPSFPLF